MHKNLYLALGALLASASASATLVPFSDSFGALPQATFSGSGIDNQNVAISTLSDGLVVLGLTAHARYFNPPNPPVTNDGQGRFFALAGPDTQAPLASALARWNFAFYVGGDAAALDDFSYVLEFDVDSTAGENFKSVSSTAAAQDSWNLGFDSFEAGFGYAFDPSQTGEYSFRLSALDDTGATVNFASIVVQVGEVPEPASLALVGIALAGAGLARRRKAA